jgi:hypothetical protein
LSYQNVELHQRRLSDGPGNGNFASGDGFNGRNSTFTNATANYNPATGTGNSGPLQITPTATNARANF